MSGFTKKRYRPRASAAPRLQPPPKPKLPPVWTNRPFVQPAMQSRATFSESSLEALSVKMTSTCEKMVCWRNDSKQRGIQRAAFQFKTITLTTGADDWMFIENLATENARPVF